MKIHEYQAKELFAAYGIPVPAQQLIRLGEDIKEAIRVFSRNEAVVKAQILAGGRGKAGGVKIAALPEKIHEAVESMLGRRLITVQSGPEGFSIRKVLLTEKISIQKEYYLSLTVSNETEGLFLIVSEAGGTEIEELSKTNPDAIRMIPVSTQIGLQSYHAQQAAEVLGLDKSASAELAEILQNMYRLFIEKDCSLIEINPLVLTNENHLTALDAKINFDDNGLMRHPDIAALADTDEIDPAESMAAAAGLSYVSLDGNIGCLVNGAGLAMATMDLIKSLGGEPANFLDVGGSASVEKVTTAFKIIFSSPKVKAVLINIFGGIMKCDVIAAAIIEAAKTTEIPCPLVVRLEGTNCEIAKTMLRESGIALIPAENLRDAGEKAVAIVKGDAQ